MADGWWDSRTRPCLNSVSITSMNLFQETTQSKTTTTTSGSDCGGGLVLDNHPRLQMMEIGLSSQPISQSLDWNNQANLYSGDQRNDHNRSGYQTLIQEDLGLSSNSSNFQENQWKSHKMYSEFKQINVRGYPLDEHAQHRHENGLNLGLEPIDHSCGSNSSVIQSLFGCDSNRSLQQDSGFDQNQGLSYCYPSSLSHTSMTVSGGGGEYPQLPPPPQEFSKTSPSKVHPPNIATQLHFSNDAQFWNASAASMNDIRSSFFPLQKQSPSSTIFEDKPKNPISISEMVKRSNIKSSSTKRPRNENPSMPPLKMKMGDRITALQQLVSPFGKTDTASVLSEAILYIKFLHEQVDVLSTPYMKNAMPQQTQILDKPSEGPIQDLRTRGLCLVPISSTLPVTQETTIDFWTPSFGGTFR